MNCTSASSRCPSAEADKPAEKPGEPGAEIPGGGGSVLQMETSCGTPSPCVMMGAQRNIVTLWTNPLLCARRFGHVTIQHLPKGNSNSGQGAQASIGIQEEA